ncbi:MAG: YecA family protein [Candidatus Helarchaeota archaeon]
MHYKDCGRENMINISESMETIETKLSNLLVQCELDTFVNVQKIKNWMANIEPRSELKANGDRFILNMLGGLFAEHHLTNTTLLNDLFNILFELYRIIPLKTLENKSKSAMFEDRAKKNVPVVLSIESFDFPPTAWVSYYEDAIERMRSKDFTGAATKFDEAFTALLDDQTTYREIYRIFCNAGLSYLLSGNKTLGIKCISIAKEINPNYKFAEFQLKNIQDGKLDPFIELCYLEKIRDSIAEFENELTYEEVQKWSKTKILKKLSKLGVKVNKNQFVEVARTVHNSDDLAIKLFYPQNQGRGIGDDFISMAASALWNIYCPDEPEVNNLNEAILNALKFVLKHPISEDVIHKRLISQYTSHFQKIKKFVCLGKKGFLKHWSKTYEFRTYARDDLIQVLKDLALIPELENRVLDLVDYLQAQLPDEYWKIVNIAVLVFKNDQAWEKIYQDLKRRHPFFCYIAYAVSRILEVAGLIEKSEQLLLEALQIIDARRDNEVWDLEEIYSTIYEDYEFILNELEKFYKRYGCLQPKSKLIKDKLKEIEIKGELYSYSFRLEKLDELTNKCIMKAEEKKANESPAIKYYQFLTRFEINFATEHEVDTKITDLTVEIINKPHQSRKTRRKIGRNESCPCGSGKKYKKCCLRKKSS